MPARSAELPYLAFGALSTFGTLSACAAFLASGDWLTRNVANICLLNRVTFDVSMLAGLLVVGKAGDLQLWQGVESPPGW